MLTDFIVDLPPSTLDGYVYNSILVVVDRFTKIAIYIVYNKTYTSEQLLTLFEREVIRRFSILDSIILDRGTIFISAY